MEAFLVTFKVPLTDASESLLGTGPFTSRKETTLAGNYAGTVSIQSFSTRCWIRSHATELELG